MEEAAEPSIASLKKMMTAKMNTSIRDNNNNNKNDVTSIDDLGEDLIQNILHRLPALAFASASCVNHHWNRLCNRILFSCPKLSSAVSFNPSLQNAVKEVLEKVLSGPIHPHFALVSVGPLFDKEGALELISRKLGSETPVIINTSEGIIGKDVHTDQFVEVQWELSDQEDDQGFILQEADSNKGVMLTVGFLPGLKAHIVPLLGQHRDPQTLLIDEFVTEIREYASNVSDSESPAGIIIYAGRETDVKPVLQAIEYAFRRDTVVVGDGGSSFVYRSNNANNNEWRRHATCAGVALVFARDRNKPLGIGETQFHALLSPGLSPVGSNYKAVSVKRNYGKTWLTASNGIPHQNLDGDSILEEIYDELGDRIQYPAFYIGVTKRRKCSVGMEKPQRMQFLEFHDVLGGSEEYLFVNSVGIKTGDPFRFYISDSKAAQSSCHKVSDNLSDLEQSSGNKVFGGIIFSCCGRGDSFFGHPLIDSSPFLENFPGVAFSGTYCAGEIHRGNSRFYDEENDESAPVHCSHHAYGAVYLIMSYRAPPLE